MNRNKLIGICFSIMLISLIGIGNISEIESKSNLIITDRNSIITAALNMDTSLTDADASFIGEMNNSDSGRSISSAGDVNGDGFDDFLIGAPYYNASKGNEGKAYLFFGDATNSLSAGINCSEADASFIGEAEDDYAGWSVAGAGDVNGDEFEDILISASSSVLAGKTGKTYLIFGRASGWARNVNLTNANVTFIGQADGDQFGWSVAGVGDVNGDEFDDILIGANLNDEGPGDTAGQTYFFYGNSTNNWLEEINCTKANASFVGENQNDQSGYSVAGAGDVNGDGFDDILIGANFNDEGPGDNAGQTYLFFGNHTGIWSMRMNCSKANASFIGEAESDQLGGSIAGAGDVNNDGFSDFIIGAYKNDDGGNMAGKTYLFFGDNINTWSMGMNCSEADASFIGEAESDQLGSSIAGAGDVNGDGFDDILMGAAVNGEGPGDSAGQTYLIYGKGSSWSKNTLVSGADASFIGEAHNDISGYSVAGAGDVNNDGYADFIIGAYGNDDGGNKAGKTYLILGSTSRSSASLIPFLLALNSEDQQIPVYPPLIILPIAVSTIIAVMFIYKRKNIR
jgi:hypothetical protein